MIFDMTSQFKRDRLAALTREATEKGWTLKVEKVRGIRSLQQNKYYWALLTIYGIETGNTPEEMHTDMREAYGMIYRKNEKTYLKSTSTLNTKEMTDYIDYIRHHAGQQGITLPDADYLKQHWQEYQEYIDQHKQFIGQ